VETTDPSVHEDAMYDESDPFYYMHTPASADGSQGEAVYATVQKMVDEVR